MGKPRPLPPLSRSRASSSRVKRSKTSSRSAAGMPCPSSEMVSSTLLAVTRVVTPTSRSAWRTALSSRFVRARVRLSRATPTSNTPLPPTVCRRTRTRAPAYRPTTSGSSRLRSLSELTGVLVSSSARARSRRSSTSPESRWTSARRSAGSCPPSPRRWATSSWVRMLASGLRSSWAASATNDRCLRRAPATRSSMSLSVVARALISSPDGGTGNRSVSDEVSSIWVAPWRSASTGLRAAPMTRHSIAASTASSRGKSTSRRVRSVRPLASRSAVGAAATTVTRFADGPASTAATCRLPERPERWPGTTTS